MWRKPSTVLFALTAAGTLALTGCGSDSAAPRAASSSATSSAAASPSSSAATTSTAASGDADAVAAVKASIALARQAKTFRVAADGVQAGNKLKVDLHYGSNGADGTVFTMNTEIGLKTVGDTIYFKAPSAFWKAQGGAQGDTIAQRFGDKWVKTAKNSTIGRGFGEFGDAEQFLAQFTKGFDDSSTAKQVGTSTVGGTPTKTYTDSTDEGTLDIAASGRPYPLKLALKPKQASDLEGTVTLSQWNESFTVEPPSESVNLPS